MGRWCLISEDIQFYKLKIVMGMVLIAAQQWEYI